MNKYLSITAIFISAYCLLLAEPSKLASNSPFLPPGYSNQKPSALPKPVKQIGGPLSQDFEFRGIVQIDSIYQFSLFRKSENKAYWISENESENGIRISDFDLDSLRITLSANGQSEQLTLMKASEEPMPVAASPAPTAGVSQPTPPIPGLNQKNAPTSTSKRRTIPRRRVILPKN